MCILLGGQARGEQKKQLFPNCLVHQWFIARTFYEPHSGVPTQLGQIICHVEYSNNSKKLHFVISIVLETYKYTNI